MVEDGSDPNTLVNRDGNAPLGGTDQPMLEKQGGASPQRRSHAPVGPVGRLPENRTEDDDPVSPLFGRGAMLALLVWGVVVLGITGGIAGATALWPLLPLVGAAVPVALVFLAVWHAKNQSEALKGREVRAVLVSDDRAERELLGALLQSDGLTPASAAARTSLGVTRAAGILEGLAGKGHLDVAAVDGDLVYSLREGGLPAAPEGEDSPGDGSIETRRERSELAPPNEPPVEPLTEREVEVTLLLASGKTNREIASELYVSHGTVKAHTANIYRKLDAHNRAEMINKAKALHLLD